MKIAHPDSRVSHKKNNKGESPRSEVVHEFCIKMKNELWYVNPNISSIKCIAIYNTDNGILSIRSVHFWNKT